MPIEINPSEFMDTVQKLKDYNDYKTRTSSGAAQAFVQLLCEENLKCQDKNGFYFAGAGAAEKAKVKITPKTVFKLKDEAHKKQLFDRVGMMLAGEIVQINGRLKYIGELLAKAKSGALKTQLDANVEPPANYYKAPPAPPKEPEIEKARQWLKKGVQGSTGAYDLVLTGNIRTDGKWWLGADEKVLLGVWKKLVTDAPGYRGFNPAVPYPSSVGGMHILKKVLADVAKERLPARGDAAWENWALFLFGAVMTAQPFPDGNKRTCRAMYAITIANAGIPFRAPTDRFGSQLGAMG